MAASFDPSNIAALTARAIDRLGTADFYDRLLDILGAAAPHELAALVRYSRSAPPDLIIPRIKPTEAMRDYYHHFFAFDPFYTHWKGGGEIGVFQLRALDPCIGRSRYAREFLMAMAIHDEIAVFLPPIGEASPTLILDRATRSFTPAELAKVHRLFPLLAALHRRHISIFIALGVDPVTSPIGQERPLRLIDHHGNQVFATEAWVEFAKSADPGVAEALATITARGPCSMRVPGYGVLRRTQLAPDFGPAPGGYCDEISAEPNRPAAGPAHGLPAALADQLTDREQQVVLLTLKGYPVIEIARKLGLSRGTVKNYRLAIYRKLDITTERELFGEYMSAIRDLG